MKITDFKNKQEPIVCLTAYTAPMAQIADQYCNLLLVGDSVSMVLYGEDSTQKADMQMMIRHGRAVAKHANDALVIVDMPYCSYESSKEQALQNATKIMQECGCNGVKLEGGAMMAETIAYLTQNNVPVMGHIGLLPQSVDEGGAYKVQGKDLDGARDLMNDAKAVEAAGAFCYVIEAVPESLAGAITAQSSVPTIGIGASAACDGQILVTEDMIGMSDRKPPKFVKQYAHIHEEIKASIKQYADEVRKGSFPSHNNVYQDKQTVPQARKRATGS